MERINEMLDLFYINKEVYEKLRRQDMRNPNRIEPCCEKLAQIWKRVPDWRLGQLLLNLFSEMEDADIFYMEDDKLLNKFDNILTRWQKERENS